jgi:RNA 2',3'-cyclic 3'-phosphodiesterase
MFLSVAISKHMHGQLSLPGFEREDLLVFALFPEPSGARCTTKVARDLCRACSLKARPLAQHRFHVSLHLLGRYDGVPNEIVAKARRAASAVAGAPFGITFDIAETLPRRRGNAPLVLRSSDPDKPLFALYDAPGEAMARNGLGGGPR